MKSTNTILLVCILSVFVFYQASTLSTIKFARELNNRLNRDIDTNFLLFGHVKEQERSPYICGSADGPYCKLISGQSLSDFVERGSEAVEKKKIEVQSYMAKISAEVEERKTKTNDFFIVFTNEYRDNALGYKNKKNTYEVQIYLNFEDFPLQSYDSQIHTPYTYTYEPQVMHGAFNAMTVTQYEQAVQMEFPNIHLPPSEKVFSKYNQKEADSDKITNDKSAINPYGVYLFTEEKFSGEIKFSKPVKISQFYLRKHNFIAYQRGNKGQENKVEFIAKGYLKGVLVEQYHKSYFGSNNKWTKMVPQSPKEIDRLWIDANQDIDNILFDLEHKSADIKLVDTTFAVKDNKFVKAGSLGDNLAAAGPVIELVQEEDGSVKIMKNGQLQYRIKEGTDNEEVFKLIADLFPEFEGYKEQIIAQGKELMKKYDGQFKTISTSSDGTKTTTISTPTSTAKITQRDSVKPKEEEKPKNI